MLELKTGFLYKKKNVTYKDIEYEIFELVDYAAGVGFHNTNDDIRIHILNGNYTGTYAYLSTKSRNEEEFVFSEDDFLTAIKNNNCRVNFTEIRKKRLLSRDNYYVRGDSGVTLIKIRNEDFIRYLQKNDKNEQADFNEDEFENATDISAMYSSIKKTIISQDEQIMQILTALFKNQTVINSDLDIDLIAKLKESILVYGPTGTGKTEIIKKISKVYNTPLVIEDATSLSETGYVGRKITDMLEDLYHAAGNNIKEAEKGILVIDEFDKLAEKSDNGEDHVSRMGVQRSLLKLLDGTPFYFNDIKFDTSKLTIVGLGAYTGITKDDDYKQIKTDDFIKYGIMRELIGRFSKTIAMNPLSKEDIIKILYESDTSPLNTYKVLFDMLKVDFSYSDEFIDYIADLAIEKQSGARSLKTVFDDCLGSALFKIFAGEYSSISLVKPDDNNNKPYILTKTKEKKHGFIKR